MGHIPGREADMGHIPGSDDQNTENTNPTGERGVAVFEPKLRRSSRQITKLTLRFLAARNVFAASMC